MLKQIIGEYGKRGILLEQDPSVVPAELDPVAGYVRAIGFEVVVLGLNRETAKSVNLQAIVATLQQEGWTVELLWN